MKLISNSGTERALDELRTWQTDKTPTNIMSPRFTVHAFDEVPDQFEKAADFRLILAAGEVVAQRLFGGPNETAMRAKLKGRWLAKRVSAWLKKSEEVRQVESTPRQSLVVAGHQGSRKALLGSCSFSTEGLGITPGNELGIVPVAETDAEAEWTCPGFVPVF